MVFPLDNVKDKIKESDLIPKKRSIGYNCLYNDMTTYIDGLYNFNRGRKACDTDVKISVLWSKHVKYDKMITIYTFTMIMSLIGYITFVLSECWTGINVLTGVVTALLSIALLIILFFCITNIVHNVKADQYNYIRTAVYYYNDYKYKNSLSVESRVMSELLESVIVQLVSIVKEENKNG